MIMKKQIVTFVTDKNLDIVTHLALLEVHKNKLHSGTRNPDAELDALLKLSSAKRKGFLAKELAWRYSPDKGKFLQPLADDMNQAWAKIEKEFIRRIEAMYRKPFVFRGVRGVLSSAKRFGYDTEKKWFAVGMFSNKYIALDTAMHELMHFMFLKYYKNFCLKRGLTKKQIWTINESFTVLLNLECNDLRFNTDFGYAEHKTLRDIIRNVWHETRDFDNALRVAMDAVKNEMV
jgi:hypothetical protein